MELSGTNHVKTT